MAEEYSTRSAQDQMAGARQWLQQRGLPMTTNNLNRAMRALYTGQDDDSASDTSERVNRNIDRTERRPAARSGGSGGGRTSDGNRVVTGGNNIVNATPNGSNPPVDGEVSQSTPFTATPREEISSSQPYVNDAMRAAAAVNPEAQAAAAEQMQTAGNGAATSLGDEMTSIVMGTAMPIVGAGNIMRSMLPNVAATLARPNMPGIAGPGMGRGFRFEQGAPPTSATPTMPSSGALPAPAPRIAGPVPRIEAPVAGPYNMPAPWVPSAPSNVPMLPPPAAAPAPARDLLAQFAGARPQSTGRQLNTGPRRGQQAMPDDAPVRQPNTSNIRRNPTRSLRDQLRRNRLEQQVR